MTGLCLTRQFPSSPMASSLLTNTMGDAAMRPAARPSLLNLPPESPLLFRPVLYTPFLGIIRRSSHSSTDPSDSLYAYLRSPTYDRTGTSNAPRTACSETSRSPLPPFRCPCENFEPSPTIGPPNASEHCMWGVIRDDRSVRGRFQCPWSHA
jgi:hypothetical protein